jgi:hypothetical protein
MGPVAFPAADSTTSDPNTLTHYERGTWKPVDASGAGLAFVNATGTYEKIGRTFIARCAVTFPSTTSSRLAAIGGLPFTVANAEDARQAFLSFRTASTLAQIAPVRSTKTAHPLTATGSRVTNASLSGTQLIFTVVSYTEA